MPDDLDTVFLKSMGWRCDKCAPPTPDMWTHPILVNNAFNKETAMEVTRRAIQGYTASHDDWEPTPADILWQTRMVQDLKDGSVWQVPSSGSEFQIFPTHKIAVLTKGDPSTPPNDRIMSVFVAMNWEVSHPGIEMKKNDELIVFMCHKVGDDLADPDGTPCNCKFCDADMLCTPQNSEFLGHPQICLICFDCAKNGPEWVGRKLGEVYGEEA